MLLLDFLGHIVEDNKFVIDFGEIEIITEIKTREGILLTCYGRDNPHDSYWIELFCFLEELLWTFAGREECKMYISNTDPVYVYLPRPMGDDVVWKISNREFQKFLTEYSGQRTIRDTHLETSIWKEVGF